jgi:hypothetical protein
VVKFSEELGKRTISCAKTIWRIGTSRWEYDILALHSETLPEYGESMVVYTPAGLRQNVVIGPAKRLNENLMNGLDGNSFGISLEYARTRLADNLSRAERYMKNHQPYPVYLSARLWEETEKARTAAKS